LPDGLFAPALVMEIAEAAEDYQVTPSEFSQIMSTVTSIVAGFAITGLIGMLTGSVFSAFEKKMGYEVLDEYGLPVPVPKV